MQNNRLKTVSLVMSFLVLAPSSAVLAIGPECPEIASAIEKNLELTNYQKGENLISQAAKKKADKKTDKKSDKKSKSEDKDAEKEDFKEPVVTNVVDVTSVQLVDNPKEYLGKNIKFQSKFFAFSSLALDYKPAMRAHKKYISLLVYRPKSKVPFSELKLAMKIPKEKDPRNKMLTSLHDGDTVEVTGNVFSTALDEPWVDILKLKIVAKKKKDKAKDKKASK